MTTILIISALSTFATAGGLGGWLIRARHRARRVRPVYVTVDGRRIRPSE